MNYFPKILNCGYVLSFRGNTFLRDISNLPQIYNHNIETMQFAGCSELENFTGLRDVAEDGTPIKYTLRLASTKIKNLSTIPRNAINKMYMARTQHFDSYKGVSDFTKLQSIEYDPNEYDLKYEISNSIELLLCKSLFQLYIPTGHTMFLIIKKHFHDDKEEYVMDCAVELIDNGFEKAAEL